MDVYNKIGFKDRIDTKPSSYLVDGETKTIEKDNSGVKQEGSNLNAENLNHMDNGIFQNSQNIKTLNDTVTKQGNSIGNLNSQYEETAKQAKVVSINNKTGNVVLTTSDIKNKNGQNIEFLISESNSNLKKEIPVQSVNSKTGKIELNAKDIKASDGTTLEEFKSKITQQIGNIKITADNTTFNSNNFKSKNVKDALNEVFTNVDNGKNAIYSAIVGKKVTPKSKDFGDLKNAINGIKLGQGNAQANDVLQGKTFTNDSGVIQTGTMPNMGSKIITPTKYIQTLGNGFYNNIKINPITPDIVKNNLSNGDISNIFRQQNPDLKPENILLGSSIAGIKGTRTFKVKTASYRIDSFGKGEPTSTQSIKLDVFPVAISCHISVYADDYEGNYNPCGVSLYEDFFRINQDLFEYKEDSYKSSMSKFCSVYNNTTALKGRYFDISVCMKSNEILVMKSSTVEGKKKESQYVRNINLNLAIWY